MWSLFTLFHLATFGVLFHSPAYSIHTLLALAVLAMPRSPWLFLVCCAHHIVYFIDHSPHYPNHELFAGLAEMMILCCAVRRIVIDRSFRLSAGRLYEDFSAPLRWGLLVLYFFAVIHKLNTDYLDSSISCAVYHYENLRNSGFTFLPHGPVSYAVAIYGSIIVEFLIPLCLAVPRARTFGFVLGITFHFMLGLVDNWRVYNFSSMLYALYFLFDARLITTALSSIPDPLREARLSSPSLVEKLLLRAVLLPILVFSLAFFSRVVWIIYAAAFLALYLFGLWKTRSATTNSESASGVNLWALPSFVFALFPLILFFDGMCPYLGLKTETSFAMFSNLRTEGGRCNSMILPRTLRLTNWQDVVHIKSSSDPLLAHQAAIRRPRTFYDFRDYLSTHQNVAVTYELNGVTHSLKQASDDPELVRPYPRVLKKLMYFRVLPLVGAPNACSH
jgi:hypothetical protein